MVIKYLIMEDAQNKQFGLIAANYFAPGTYMHRLRAELVSSGLPGLLVTTLLAPLERWRLIAQTQSAYPLRPKKISLLEFCRSTPGTSTQESPGSKESPPSGAATPPLS
jgi:hypothetical protein